MKRLPWLAAGFVLVFAGCGGEDGGGGGAAAVESKYKRQLAEAAAVQPSDMPPTAGKTLEQLAGEATTQTNIGLATSVLVPGKNRFGFGVIDQEQSFVYGKSAVYVAESPGSKAKGPFVAPADSLVTEPAFRSQSAAAEGDPIAAIYAARVPFGKPGRYPILVLTKTNDGLLGGTSEVQVLKKDPIPAVGERPPAAETETTADAGGALEKIDTRVPPAPSLHAESFNEVLGKKPVALLFATPQLCESRVCGPVVDIELQMQKRYGDEMEFIHQEVYEGNDPNKGLREPLREFNLQTEPWLFTVGRDGRIAARLEGSFGVRDFEAAVKAALD